MQNIAAEKRLHKCPTEIKVAHRGLACWELQGITILIPFYLVYVSVVSQRAAPRGMKAWNNPFTTTTVSYSAKPAPVRLLRN